MLIAIIDFDLKELEEFKEMETIWKIINSKSLMDKARDIAKQKYGI